MAPGNASRILRVPGKIVIGPTDLSLDYPFGGVEVGLTRAVVLQSIATSFRVVSEGLGESTDLLESGNHYVMACFIRGMDDDAMRLMFTEFYGAGHRTGHALLTIPQDHRPGSSALPRARRILYVPDDPVAAPSLLIDRGIPDWREGSEVAMQRATEFGFPLAVECYRTDAGRILQLGRLSDITLA